MQSFWLVVPRGGSPYVSYHCGCDGVPGRLRFLRIVLVIRFLPPPVWCGRTRWSGAVRHRAVDSACLGVVLNTAHKQAEAPEGLWVGAGAWAAG